MLDPNPDCLIVKFTVKTWACLEVMLNKPCRNVAFGYTVLLWNSIHGLGIVVSRYVVAQSLGAPSLVGQQ
jgi:hypothetical protein